MYYRRHYVPSNLFSLAFTGHVVAYQTPLVQNPSPNLG